LLTVDAVGVSGVLLNDSSQTANSRLWGFRNDTTVFAIATYTDAGSSTDRLTVNRSGQAVFGSGTPQGSAVLTVDGAGGTSYTNADFHVRNSSTPTKHIAMWYDTSGDAGRIQAVHTGTAFKDLWLQTQGGKVICGGAVDINGTLTLSAQNIVTDTTTGMKIGTSTSQKIGFFNATPVTQRSSIEVLTDSTTGTAGLTVNDVTSSFSQSILNNNFATITRHLNRIEQVLQDLGLTA
jgi:hypothetical protein